MYKVLIVDDMDILRYDMKRMKIWGETSGFAIQDEAENGKEALAKLRESDFDLVITDIRMPVMDGMELLKAISNEKLCPCVALLSDFTEYSYAREGILHGAFDYLGKPVDSQSLSELLKRIREFLDNKNREKAKLKHLEVLAEEAFFPSLEVDKVVALLIKGREETKEACEQLIESVGAALNYDVSKSVIILENIIGTIHDRILNEYGWISLYSDLMEFRGLNFDENHDWQIIKSRIFKLCGMFLSYLKKFIIWSDGQEPIKKACLHVLWHIEDGISVKGVAEKLFISKAYLSEMFKQNTGISLLEYINTVKMERAKYLLVKSSLKNYEIADRLGFNDHEYFSKIFKKHAGLTPAVYRRKNTII